MKNVKKILMALAMLTTLNASAIYRLAPEDVEYFIQYYSSYFPYVNNQPTRYAIYSEVTSGDYDSDQGAFFAPITRSALPSFTWGDWNDGDILGVTYGIAILRYNPYDDYYYYEDYDYIYYDGNNNLCDYEQTNGIYQIHYDEPYDPEDEMANPIEGAFSEEAFQPHAT